MALRGDAGNALLFRRGTQAYRWLALQAQVWEPATRRALQQVGLAAGQSALDAGCGTGEVLPLLAELVGRHGRVTGLDIDGMLAQEALDQRSGQPPLVDLPDVCRIVTGDLLSLPRVAGEPFDLVFARSLLFAAPEPLTLLRRLWGLVRDGGALLVMEHDFTAMRPLSEHAAFDRASGLLRDAWRVQRRDPAIGAQMPLWFEVAGLGTADGCEPGGAIQRAAPSTALLRSLLEEIHPAVIGAGLADEAQRHRLDGDLAAAAADPVWLRWPDLVATWKRKDGGSA